MTDLNHQFFNSYLTAISNRTVYTDKVKVMAVNKRKY